MQDPSSVPYHKNKEVYEPEISNEAFYHCGLERVAGRKKCEFCSSILYQSIERSMKEMLYAVRYRCLKSNEDMIFALAGQSKQLSHEPEKFRCLNGIRTHDCDAGAVL